MKLTKGLVAALIVTLIFGSASYFVGRTGFDVGRAITDSRCGAGAFIAHAKSPSTVSADAHSDETVTASLTSDVGSPGYAPIAVSTTNLIPNGSLEAAGQTSPQNWESNVYGNNNGSFKTVAGYHSKTALRIDITRYTGGTADWFTPTLTPVPGAYYQFQDYYRSNVVTRPVLTLIDNTGKSQYINLQPVPASDQWALDTQRFFVPANIAHIMVSRPLDRTGWLETDNYTLNRAAAPAYSEGMVSLTFDDGWTSIYANALPLMKRYDVVSTQYVVSGFLGSLKQYMTPRQLYAFQTAGHEIASHTVDHPDLTKVSDPELTRQLRVSDQGLSKCYGNVTDFAPPFGASDSRTLAAEGGLYQTSRSTEVGFNSADTLNPYQLKVQNVRAGTSPEQMKAWLDTARDDHVWLILVYHQVENGPGEYTRSPANFESDLQAIKASGLAVKTVHDAYSSVQSQNPTK